MVKNYRKTCPKYKQEAFHKIENVIIGLLNEVNFFRVYPWLKEEPRIFLSYEEQDFKREKEEARGGIVKGFHVFVGGSYLFTLKGKEVQTISKLRKQLTDDEYSTVYKNLEVLHQFPGERGTMLESKIGRIVKYDLANHGTEFVGQFGDTHREERRLAR